MRSSSLSLVLAAGLTALLSACSTTTAPTDSMAPGPPTPPASTPVPPAAEPNPEPVPPSLPAPATARYRVTFDATWSPATHPVDIPGSAHFSPLVGSTHSALVRFWAEGELASEGIQKMAERGHTSPLDDEMRAAVTAGAAGQVFVGGAVDKSPGSVSLEFTISQSFPLVTLVSMIAPSPDWFVGVSGLSLFENGRWADERRVDLIPWDAGTDSGVTFFAPDAVTLPQERITRILTTPLSPGGRVTPLGSFTFTRIG